MELREIWKNAIFNFECKFVSRSEKFVKDLCLHTKTLKKANTTTSSKFVKKSFAYVIICVY